VAEAVARSRPTLVFKKCDSVLRGPVLAEARAAAAALGLSKLLVVSANPSRGRIIRDGIYLIEGRPLDQTGFARDPEHPRKSSRVAELLGDDLAGVAFPDATSEEDVARHAQALDAETLAVGGADFFEAILRARFPGGAVNDQTDPTDQTDQTDRTDQTDLEARAAPSALTLLVCGSAASWSRRRAGAEELRLPVFALPHDWPAILAASRTRSRLVIGIGDGEATRHATPSALAATLADTVRRILHERPVARLLTEGGATSAAVLRVMGWERLQVVETAPNGVGVLRPVGVSGPTVYIKPGSYEWPVEIWPGSVG
jgi:uncharacterized protein YgbK (DUF1537 family)